MISVNANALSAHGKITAQTAVTAIGVAIAGYLAAVWFVHDNLLGKSGIRRYELLILAAVVLSIAILNGSVLFMGLAFVCFDVIKFACRSRIRMKGICNVERLAVAGL